MSDGEERKVDAGMPQAWRLRTIVHDFFRIELHSDGLMWLRRNDNLYRTLDDVRRGYDEFLALADEWCAERAGPGGRARLGFLYDVREAAAPSNDPAFENVHHEMRPELLRRTTALVVLVRSAAGMMQMSRLGREDGSRFFTTQDEAEALRVVREKMMRPR